MYQMMKSMHFSVCSVVQVDINLMAISTGFFVCFATGSFCCFQIFAVVWLSSSVPVILLDDLPAEYYN